MKDENVSEDLVNFSLFAAGVNGKQVKEWQMNLRKWIAWCTVDTKYLDTAVVSELVVGKVQLLNKE